MREKKSEPQKAKLQEDTPKEVPAVRYVKNKYGQLVSEQAMTLREWEEQTPLDPNECEESKELAKALREHMAKIEELTKEFAADIVTIGDIAPREWLIEGILPRGTLNFIGGDPGIGKTLLVLQMAACLMTGQPFLGRDTSTAKVFLVERDESMEGIKDKITKQLIRYPVLERMEIYSGQLRLDDKSFKLSNLVLFKMPEVLFIDSYSSLHYKDENSASEMRPILDCLRSVIDEFGTTIVCIHHFTRSRESGKKGHLRGSTAIEAQADFALGLEKGGKELFLKPLKVRGEFEDIKLLMDKKTLTFDASERVTKGSKMMQRYRFIQSLLVDKTPREHIIKMVANKFEISERQVQRDLKSLSE